MQNKFNKDDEKMLKDIHNIILKIYEDVYQIDICQLIRFKYILQYSIKFKEIKNFILNLILLILLIVLIGGYCYNNYFIIMVDIILFVVNLIILHKNEELLNGYYELLLKINQRID